MKPIQAKPATGQTSYKTLRGTKAKRPSRQKYVVARRFPGADVKPKARTTSVPRSSLTNSVSSSVMRFKEFLNEGTSLKFKPKFEPELPRSTKELDDLTKHISNPFSLKSLRNHWSKSKDVKDFYRRVRDDVSLSQERKLIDAIDELEKTSPPVTAKDITPAGYERAGAQPKPAPSTPRREPRRRSPGREEPRRRFTPAKPVEKPVETPPAKPAEPAKPVEKPAKPAEPAKPVEKPTEKPAKPAEPAKPAKPAEEPAPAKAPAPAKEPAIKPAPARVPAEEPAPAKAPAKEPAPAKAPARAAEPAPRAQTAAATKPGVKTASVTTTLPPRVPPEQGEGKGKRKWNLPAIGFAERLPKIRSIGGGGWSVNKPG